LHQPVYRNSVPGAKLYAIRGGANNADIINVRALNVWNYSGRGLESEGFPLNVEHDNSKKKNDLILFDGCDQCNRSSSHNWDCIQNSD
jgi:hypothetical protein